MKRSGRTGKGGTTTARRRTRAAGGKRRGASGPGVVAANTGSNPTASAPATVDSRPSPRWSASAKLIVALTAIALAALLVVRFGHLLRLLVVAGIVAFVLVPLVRFIHQRARLSWRTSTHVAFLLLILVLAVTFTATGLALARDIQSLVFTIQTLLRDLPGLVDRLAAQAITIGPFELDLSSYDLESLARQAQVYLAPLLGEASGIVRALAGGAIETVAQTLFILAAAYFLTLDQPALIRTWRQTALPGFDYDWRRLRVALDRIWAAFLRGQILLALVIGVAVTVGLSVLGVRNALVLGLVSGLLEFLPIVGPFIAGAIAALVALFQPSNWWGLPPVTFTLVVIAFFIIVQQIENNVLVPRILGTALNLHPVVILVAAVIGATLAGVIGILLSAPTVATLYLLGRYVYRKVFDLPPWSPPIDGIVEELPAEPSRRRWWTFWRRQPPVEAGTDGGTEKHA